MATTITGVILLLLGLGTSYLAHTYGLGGFHAPGPGFFPMGVGAFLAILALLYLFTNRGGVKVEGRKWVRPLLAIVLSFLYVAFLEKLGYLLDTVLMLLVFVGGIERQKLVRTVAVAVLATAAMYLVFAVWLRVPLPKGQLPLFNSTPAAAAPAERR
jgi:hypothetical protein